MSTSGWSSLGLWKQCYCFRRKQPYWFSVAVSCESVLLDFVNQHYMSYYLSVKIVIHLFQWGMAVSMYNLYRCVQSHSVDSTVTVTLSVHTHTHTHWQSAQLRTPPSSAVYTSWQRCFPGDTSERCLKLILNLKELTIFCRTMSNVGSEFQMWENRGWKGEKEREKRKKHVTTSKRGCWVEHFTCMLTHVLVF